MEQFPAREEEEVTETEVARDGRPVVPSSGYEDPLHYEDPVMQISGAGHWFLEGWIGDHSGGLGIFGDSYVRQFLSKSGMCGRTVRRAPSYSEDAAQRESYWY